MDMYDATSPADALRTDDDGGGDVGESPAAR